MIKLLINKLWASVIAVTMISCNPTSHVETLYIGSGNRGLFCVDIDLDNNSFGDIKSISQVEAPTYFTFSTDNRYIYSVNEMSAEELSEKSIDTSKFGVSLLQESSSDNHNLTTINQFGSYGISPCYIEYSPEVPFRESALLSIANYSTGTIAIYRQSSDNGELLNIFNHNFNVDGEPESRAHCSKTTPDGKYLLVTDLGQDKIYSIPITDSNISEQREVTTAVTLPKGSGPRHLIFNPVNSSIAYVINELNSTITVMLYSSDSGSLSIVKTYSALPESRDSSIDSYCADIHISPDSKFLYGSNRGDNSIVIFSMDNNSGELTLVGHESTGGNWPRNFTLTPSGSHLIVANRRSNNIVLFKRDATDGKLTRCSDQLEIDAPVCLKFR